MFGNIFFKCFQNKSDCFGITESVPQYFWNISEKNLNCSRTLWNVSKQAKGFRTLWKRNLDMMQTSQNVFGTLWNLFPKHIWLFSNKSMYEHFWNVHILNCSWIIWIVSKQIWMFRNTFENFQMFRNTFQILPKYLFWNVSETLKKSKCFPKQIWKVRMFSKITLK